MRIFRIIASIALIIPSLVFADFTLSFNPANYLELTINQYGNFKYKILSNGSIKRNFSNQIGSFGDIQIQRSFSNKISRIGDITFSYSQNGKVIQIGDYQLSYNFNGKLVSIGNISISYNFSGKVIQAGNCAISYNFNGEVSSIDGDVGEGMSITAF